MHIAKEKQKNHFAAQHLKIAWWLYSGISQTMKVQILELRMKMWNTYLIEDG